MTTYEHGAMAPGQMPDVEPDDATVAQEEAPPGLGCIPVTVEGPVRSVELPAKSSGSRRYGVTTTEAFRVLGRDPRRKRALIQCSDATGASHGLFHGATANEVTPPADYAARLAMTNAGAGLPAASPVLEITSTDELWVLADTAACDVSVTSEQWAD